MTHARLSLAAALITALGGAAPAQDVPAGAYLAGRYASLTFDFGSAATFYTQALLADASNPELLENALQAQVALGAFDKALPIATRMQAAGLQSQVANLVVTAGAIKRGAFDAVQKDIAGGKSVGGLVDGLVMSWTELGLGRMSEAQSGFDKLAQTKGIEAFGLYHKALALASAGDFEGADQILSGDAAGPLRLTRRGVVARAEILSQLERDPDAVALIDAAFGGDLDPGVAALRDRLAKGEAVPFDVVRTPEEGLAEVFYTVATALNGEGNDGLTLLYVRVATELRPDFVAATLLTASLLESQKQYDLATATYARVPASDPSFYAAELGRSDALFAAGKEDAALEVMQQLSRTEPDVPVVWTSLGDLFRRLERFADAEAAYDKAVDLLGAPQAGQWVVYYSRGIARERQHAMDTGEADFREALKLSPDQPQVLNYLGYAFVEEGRNLDEALGMIERAVAARPEDGYVTDSLGWALFTLGRYQDAVAPMERATLLEAVDPILNDHLGDVYWAVDRKREAEFQWRRALSFDPEPEDAARIRRKLEVGLDAVRQEEGAKPLPVANGN